MLLVDRAGNETRRSLRYVVVEDPPPVLVSVEPSDGAEVTEYPDGHAYPGLVDALSTAYGDDLVLADKSSDAGTEILDGLDPSHALSRSLAEWGVTTAYVSNRGATQWRGMGAIVHPQTDGFAPAAGDHASAAAVQMRISKLNNTILPAMQEQK